ncbi:TIGR03084 family metal-binding protein [Rhodococcus sp. OK302]|uniref:TIGR03084 family metal-binding protein n=1 Tax=Rhodococcus sp. OK302 TaxID=1882769 RepID=UPI000B93C4E7|nr:TIGR03084 family metal-binding protein [Rhodococcus sp. OK302]OYD66518.1 uncharacterized protein (TIGR03084 family) [Rhodococcus sp. OK302]
MAVDYPALLHDLRGESDAIRDVLTDLEPPQWETPTPAEGWSIRDQVSHLAYFDDAAVTAMSDADTFRREATALMARGENFPDLVAEEYRHLTVGDLLTWFSESRAGLLDAFAANDSRKRIPWYGPEMSVASSATARLMETWAHGQDIFDTLGVIHPPSAGLRSIAHLGVSTFAFSHTLNDRAVPAEPVRVELQAPDSSEIWSWGPETAEHRVTGPAADFVLVVTQRRNFSDTALEAEGVVAQSWMGIAQAYAGAPGPGRSRSSAAIATGENS